MLVCSRKHSTAMSRLLLAAACSVAALLGAAVPAPAQTFQTVVGSGCGSPPTWRLSWAWHGGTRTFGILPTTPFCGGAGDVTYVIVGMPLARANPLPMPPACLAGCGQACGEIVCLIGATHTFQVPAGVTGPLCFQSVCLRTTPCVTVTTGLVATF